MKHETLTFIAHDGIEIFVNKWSPEHKAKGIVQIAHGVCEHSGRYEHFATNLTQKGYVVYANDHRGHGNTAGISENMIYLGENGWNSMVRDTYDLTCIIKNTHPRLPLFFFAHSMGSFVLRQYLYEYPNKLKGVILSGTGSYDRVLLNTGVLIAKRLVEKNGARRSYYLNKMVFASFNNKINNPKTLFDWLTRDEDIIKKYMADPKCGAHCTNNFFYELLKGLRELQKTKNLVKIPKNIPILLVSGDNDPVGHWGSDIPFLVKQYKHFGVKDVKAYIFKGARHEIINEINREQVMEYIIKWINSHNNHSIKSYGTLNKEC
jgi:alpha-beta hydrolase superfamily lysophospholipase